jgi:hypothetical protein
MYAYLLLISHGGRLVFIFLKLYTIQARVLMLFHYIWQQRNENYGLKNIAETSVPASKFHIFHVMLVFCTKLKLQKDLVTILPRFLEVARPPGVAPG